MSTDEGLEFSLPSIPYFYHDIVARIIPGAFQLGLIGVLTRHHCPACVNDTTLAAIVAASQVGVLLALLAASYLIGVVFEGLLYFVVSTMKPMSSAYHRVFVAALNGIREDHAVTGPLCRADAASLAEPSAAILESFEPLVPHFFARAARFLAEAKMMMFSAAALPIAVVVVGAMTTRWKPPGGWQGIVVGVVVFAVFVAASFARQRRRAVEILRCVEDLAGRTEPVDAHKRASEVWSKVLSQHSRDTTEVTRGL